MATVKWCRTATAGRSRPATGRSFVLSSLLIGCIGFGPGVVAGAPKTTATFHPSLGHAADVALAKTGDIVVSLGQAADPVGLQIFEPAGFTNPCGGDTIVDLTSLPVGIASAFGLGTLPDRPAQSSTNRQSIGVAVEQNGVEFLRFNPGNCKLDGDINVPQLPVTGSSPGTFAVAVTPNGRHAFIANEYGEADTSPDFNFNQGGTVGIVRTRRDRVGRFTGGTQQVGPVGYIYIRGANTIPGVTVSHDGKRLYVVNEGATSKQPIHFGGHPFNNPTGIANPALVNEQCVNEFGSSDAYALNGLLTVIDVKKAVAGLGQDAIIRTIAAGCSPVRVVETADGSHVFVASRGGNPGTVGSDPPPGSIGRIIVFDVKKLTSPRRHRVNKSPVSVFNSAGTAPVGMTLFADDGLLAVANSNRFTSGEGKTNVAIFDVSRRKAPKRKTVCASPELFSFPRGVTAAGNTLYVANFGSLPDNFNVPGAFEVIEYAAGLRGCAVGPYPPAPDRTPPAATEVLAQAGR